MVVTKTIYQSLILAQLHLIFENLPVENRNFQNQQEYYDAINNSTQATDCGIFIEFMLEEILATLRKKQGDRLDQHENGAVNGVVNGVVKKVYEFIVQNEGCRKPLIAEKTKIPVKTIEKHIVRLIEMNKIEFRGAPKSGGYFIIGK